MIFSSSMIIPLLIALWFRDGAWLEFLIAFCLTFGIGFFFWLPVRKIKRDLKNRDGFLVVVLFWTVLGLFGSIPFMLSQHPHLSFTDAVFESVSGLTTTGASVIAGIEYLPHALMFYRQELQFLGGMGIVVLAVAILPMLGIGGLQLYRAEMPGPSKEHKLTPRIAESAKALWFIYVGLTVICALAYWGAGMTLFDAIGESFSTISTGGFTMHDDSFAFYRSPLINSIAVIFMIIGSTNFALHFTAFQRISLKGYFQDSEFQMYIWLLVLSSFITTVVLIIYGTYKHPTTAVSQAIFNAVSLGTNTGFTSAPFQSWPSFLPLMLMMATMIGGCASSTSGGVKVIRVLLLSRQSIREILRLVHPNAVLTVRLGDKTLSEDVVQAIWGFIAAFTVLFMLLGIVLMGAGMDYETVFGALVACLANAGVGVGDIANNFSGLNAVSKWVLVFAMIAGRLEIFTLLVLFTPAFWRK